MRKAISRTIKRIFDIKKRSCPRLALKFSGALALAWFLIRVIPKPSRANYPCQRAAFPLASSFVIWVCGMLTIKACGKYFSRGRLAAGGALVFLAAVVWTIIAFTGDSAAQNTVPKKPSDWNFIPAPPNQPVGGARGIFPQNHPDQHAGACQQRPDSVVSKWPYGLELWRTNFATHF